MSTSKAPLYSASFDLCAWLLRHFDDDHGVLARQLMPGPKMKRRLRQRLHNAEALGVERLARGLAAYRGVLTPF